MSPVHVGALLVSVCWEISLHQTPFLPSLFLIGVLLIVRRGQFISLLGLWWPPGYAHRHETLQLTAECRGHRRLHVLLVSHHSDEQKWPQVLTATAFSYFCKRDCSAREFGARSFQGGGKRSTQS